jgi:hypothetical protein
MKEIWAKQTVTQIIDETKSWFFKNVNKSNKALVNLNKNRREKTQITKIRDEKGDIKTNNIEIQRINREYFEDLHSNWKT